MKGGSIFCRFTLALAILNTCLTFTKFRMKMVPRGSYRDGLDVPQDMLEDFYEGKYPTNDTVGKYLVREKHFPYNDDLVYDDDSPPEDEQITSTDVLNKILIKKMHNKKSLKLCLTKPVKDMHMIIY
jgi:hypothetical protein